MLNIKELNLRHPLSHPLPSLIRHCIITNLVEDANTLTTVFVERRSGIETKSE